MKFLISLAEEDQGREFICSYISDLDSIDDIMFEIFSDCMLRLRYPFGGYLGDVGKKRPRDCISLAEKILKNHPEDESLIFSFSYGIFTICKQYPKYLQEIKKWFMHLAPVLQAASVDAILYHYSTRDLKETLQFFNGCVHNKNVFVRRYVSRIFGYSLPYNKSFIQSIMELCEDEDADVRRGCARSLANLVIGDKKWFKIIKEWSYSSSSSIREIIAFVVGALFQTGATEVLRMINEFADDSDERIRISLAKALLGAIDAKGQPTRAPVERDSERVVPILEGIIEKGSSELRKNLEYDFATYRNESLREVILSWFLKHEWPFRHMAILIYSRSLDTLDPLIVRSLSRDPRPEIRRELPWVLVFHGSVSNYNISILTGLIDDVESNRTS